MDLILKQAWDSLEQHAQKDIKTQTSTLVSMQPRQKTLASVAVKSKALERILALEWTPLARRKDWPEARAKIAEELSRKNLSPQQIEDVLSRLSSLNSRSIQESIGTALSHSVSQLDFLAERNLAYFIGATIALSVARFNRAVASRSSISGAIAQSTKTLAADLLSNERNLWRALRNGNLTEANRIAQYLADWATDLLLNKVIDQAAAIAKKRQGVPGNKQDDLAGLQIGSLIRGLLLAIAIGKRVAWLTRWGPTLDPTQHWFRAASRLSFMPTYKPPARVSIATLAAHPARFDGQSVSVRGVLGEVTIVHRAKKAVSSVSISTPNGKSILAILPYIKLDSGGMVRGAYVEIAGIWQLKPKEAKGPALLIDRRNLGEESKKSWLAWIELSLRRVIEVVPHQLAARWSWESGPDGAGNGLLYGTWFAK